MAYLKHWTNTVYTKIDSCFSNKSTKKSALHSALSNYFISAEILGFSIKLVENFMTLNCNGCLAYLLNLPKYVF